MIEPTATIESYRDSGLLRVEVRAGGMISVRWSTHTQDANEVARRLIRQMRDDQEEGRP